MKQGIVYLVGAGPGDPKLLTLRAQELLCSADVVAYDHLVSPRALRWCPPRAKRIYVGKEPGESVSGTCRGKRFGNGARHLQRNINALLIREARAGKTVVRLKGGDPFLFGRGAEEALELRRAGVRFEIVPGVTSALAVPAYAGIPLTERRYSSSVAIVTGHEDPVKPMTAVRWDRLATATDTLVILMGVGALDQIATRLVRHGRASSTPCAVIEWGTLPRQRTVAATLVTIARKARAARVRSPAVVVVGDVVALRRPLGWFETAPLFGTRILVTRASDQSAAFAESLETLGAEVAQLPAIELVPVKPNGAFRTAVRDIPRTDWVFFTSPEGIGWFSKLLKPYRRDVRALAGCHIGAIGPKTADAIEARGLHVDFVPKRFSQEGLVKELPRRVLAGKRALILSAEESRDVLSDGLRRRGMRVTKLPIYRTVIPEALRRGAARLLEEPFDFVTVTSASCVAHLHQTLQAAGRPRLFTRLRFASIGPITSQAIRARTGRVAVEAKVSTVEGLTEAILRARRR